MKLSFLPPLPVFRLPAIVGADAPRQQLAVASIARIKEELPELLAAAVVDLASGRAVASYSSKSAGLRPDKAAPFNTEVIRQKQRALRALDLPDEHIEDILITLREQLHLMRVSADGRTLLYLVVSMEDTNLALARDVLHAYCS